MHKADRPADSEAWKESRRIARAAGVLSSATALSRVLGFVRDVVTAAYFGAAGSMDAFLVAFRLPNLLRSLFAEGSLTVAFVPVFVQELEEGGRARADRLGRSAFTLLGAVLLVVSAAGVLWAPPLVRVLAWGFSLEPAKLALTVELTRIVFPYTALIGLTALAGGMLNAFGDFASPALAPVVLNVGILAGTVGLYRLCDPPIRSVAYGVLLGGTCQLLLQAGSLRRRGFRFRPRWRWEPGLRAILTRMGPRVFGVGVYQINVMVTSFLATWLPSGSVSYLYYAERLFQLPLGVFAVAVGTASLPSLSRLAARKDTAGLLTTLAEALRLTAVIVVPAAAGLMVLAGPIVTVLLRRGSFDAEMAQATAQALLFYSAALIPLAGLKLIAPAYYAVDNTATPVHAAFWSVVVNLGASVLLLEPMKHAGLALATTLSSAFNFVWLLLALRRRIGPVPYARIGRSLGRTAAAAAGMAIVVGFLSRWVPWEGGWSGTARGAALLAIIATGVGAYGALSHALGERDISRLLGALPLRRRSGR
ncbi:MAG: murein biosynthesis integral membrane protein MurJ [Deltaproteobacteria bacterium]|nr:murein biosynthesis integral membrane protein MurJ [Deltaproteobacteria bacterium]